MIKVTSQSAASNAATHSQTTGNPGNISQIIVKKDQKLAKSDAFLATVLKGDKIVGETLTRAKNLFEQIKAARMGLAIALVDENEEDADELYETLMSLRGEVFVLLPEPGRYYLSVD